MNPHDDLPDLTKLILYGLKHDLFDDDVGQTLLELWDADLVDERIRGIFEQRVRADRIRQAFHPHPFRVPKLTVGNLVLGIDMRGQPICIPLQYLNAHCLNLAGSGAGKTTRARFFALQILRLVRGAWLVDLRKREFRVLRPLLARAGVDLIVVPASAMRLNPLQVPLGVEPAAWSARVADMLILVLGLPPGASRVLQILVYRLYDEFGVLAGASKYPTLMDLLAAIDKSTDDHVQARRALSAHLRPILLRMHDVLNWRVGWSPHDLARRHLVFEFDGLSEVDKNLILNYLVIAEFSSRIARHISNPQMDLWISCDEAGRLIGATEGSRLSGVNDLIGLVRGTGIGLDLSVLSIPSKDILSNTATKLLGRCGGAGDYAEAGRCMGLSAEQIHWAQQHLEPGLFIGSLGEGPFREPFVFRVPKMKFPT